MSCATCGVAGAGHGTAVASDTLRLRQAAEHERDAEALKTPAAKGRVLPSRDRVNLPPYDDCSMAVVAAERGDFRDCVEAAARALLVVGRTDDAGQAAWFKLDRAIASRYPGDLEDAERRAREALAAHAQVYAPAHKLLDDVARRGNPSAAFAAYHRALETASERFRPLVLVSLTNAQIAAGDTARARATFEKPGAPATADLAAMYRRIEGNPLLADASLSDANYDRLWAHEGIAQAYLARGPHALAVDDLEKIRARICINAFKTGLFPDTPLVLGQAIELAVEAGDSDGLTGRPLLIARADMEAAVGILKEAKRENP